MLVSLFSLAAVLAALAVLVRFSSPEYSATDELHYCSRRAVAPSPTIFQALRDTARGNDFATLAN